MGMGMMHDVKNSKIDKNGAATKVFQLMTFPQGRDLQRKKSIPLMMYKIRPHWGRAGPSLPEGFRNGSDNCAMLTVACALVSKHTPPATCPLKWRWRVPALLVNSSGALLVQRPISISRGPAQRSTALIPRRGGGASESPLSLFQKAIIPNLGFYFRHVIYRADEEVRSIARVLSAETANFFQLESDSREYAISFP
jgi:hypothetical protein